MHTVASCHHNHINGNVAETEMLPDPTIVSSYRAIVATIRTIPALEGLRAAAIPSSVRVGFWLVYLLSFRFVGFWLVYKQASVYGFSRI